MNKSQPTTSHVSYGGDLEVTDIDPIEHCLVHGEVTSLNGDPTKENLVLPSDYRAWETICKRSCTRGVPSVQFTVMSYNVLAQYLLETYSHLYTHCAPCDLEWKTRASRLYDEIVSCSPDGTHYQCDINSVRAVSIGCKSAISILYSACITPTTINEILCLQEVQSSHKESFYSKFEQIGYHGIFKSRTGHRDDGCAIFYKHSLFELNDYITVEFRQPDLPILNECDNIGLMVKLTPRDLPTSAVVVATTHLLYNTARTDVRLAQMQLFLAEIDRFAYYNNGKLSSHLPIILTGDFNSTPESVVIQLLDRGLLHASSFRDQSDWERIGVTDNCQHLSVFLNRQEGRPTSCVDIKIHHSDLCGKSSKKFLKPRPKDKFKPIFNTEYVGHFLKLMSVYENSKSDEASTHRGDWVTVDYIYYSCRSPLKLVERLLLPSHSERKVLGRIPNQVFPSDHLSLAAKFRLRSCISPFAGNAPWRTM